LISDHRLKLATKKTRQTPMVDSEAYTSRLSAQLLRRRWLLVVLVGLTFVGFELIEHFNPARGLDAHFTRELLFFGVATPLALGMALTLLTRAREQLVDAYYRLDRQHTLSQQLSNVESWEELTKVLAEFPHTVVPLVGVSLFVNDLIQTRFELVTEWWDGACKIASGTPRIVNQVHCSTCGTAQSSVLCLSKPDQCELVSRIPDHCDCYRLKLSNGGKPVGLLFLYVTSGLRFTTRQADVLNSMASTMALAIDNARPQRAAIIRAEAGKAERERMARELHDTLGQSLGYVHLKLDQLANGDGLTEIEVIRKELERIRDVADQAYEQVRGTLTDLRSIRSSDLATALLNQARAVGERAGFKVQLTSEGQARALAPHIQEQVEGLCQEALSNIEKHAHARHVNIDLDWTEDTLTVHLCDDGRGFEPEALQTNGHYGLAIMRERAGEVEGSIEVASCPAGGTQVTLRLPLNPQGAEER
jgi:signal transduction histidine kinase